MGVRQASNPPTHNDKVDVDEGLLAVFYVPNHVPGQQLEFEAQRRIPGSFCFASSLEKNITK